MWYSILAKQQGKMKLLLQGIGIFKAELQSRRG